MASGKRPPSGTRRRRPAPTIDLEATEIPAASSVLPAPSRPSAAPPPAGRSFEPATEPPPPPPPPQPPYQRYAQRPEPPDDARGRLGVAWLPPGIPWPLVGAGAAGAAGVLAAVLLIWLIAPRGSDPAAALAPRLAAIENQLRELAARPPVPSADPKAVEALAARLAKTETALAAPRPPSTDAALANRVAALETAIKPQSEALAALARRSDEAGAAIREARGRADAAAAQLTELQSAARTTTADHGEIAKLSNRIAALEKADRAVADELARRAITAGSDRPVRLAVAAAALRNTLERGDPFAAELATVRPLSSDASALAALEPFGAAGVPSAPALGRELSALIPAMQRVAGATPRDSGILDRLQANAEKLVRVRPVGETPGDDSAAILSRIEIKAAHADIGGALAELAKLPPAVRAPAAGWIAKAEARNKAVDASRRLAAEAVAALKTTP